MSGNFPIAVTSLEIADIFKNIKWKGKEALVLSA
jgi:hypothetical protein